MPAIGRPVEYSPDIHLIGISQYRLQCEEKQRMPTVEGLAVFLRVARSTIYDWCDRKSPRFQEVFSDNVEQMLAEQADELIQKGLVGTFTSPITKVLLSKHRAMDGLPYRDAHDVTTGGEPILDEQAREKARKAREELFSGGAAREGE